MLGDYAVNHVPVECWENILGHLSPAELARAASVNKACGLACQDQRLWAPHVLRGWVPESHVSPYPHGKGCSGGRSAKCQGPRHIFPAHYACTSRRKRTDSLVSSTSNTIGIHILAP
jgi:hypothetical protein